MKEISGKNLVFFRSLPKLPVVLSCLLILNTFLSLTAHASNESYSIHFRSYKDAKNADEEIAILKRFGYDSFYRYEDVKGKGRWYMVYAGKYRSERVAEREAKALKESGLIGDYTIRNIAELPDSTEPPHTDFSESDYGRDDYCLHVSSFKKRPIADRVVGELRGYGLNPFLTQEEVSGKSIFRVYIGTFRDEREALVKGLEWKTKGLISYYNPVRLAERLRHRYRPDDPLR